MTRFLSEVDQFGEPADLPPVKGYRDITPEMLSAVNGLKEFEEVTLRRIEGLTDVDPRWIAIAKTHIQQGYMAAIRAVMQPQRIALPGDHA